MFKINKLIKINLIKLLVGLLLISFAGIEYTSDTDVSNFFIKGKPSLKFEYHPPRSVYEPIETLSEKDKEEYHEYVEVVTRRSYTRILDRISIFIIVLATVLMTSGLMGLIVNKKTKEIKLLLLDYFMQFAFATILGVFYRHSPIRNPQFDGHLVILLFFLLSFTFDYLNRMALTRNMQKQQTT